MRFVLTRDAREFAARTDALLASRIECNMLATILMSLLDGANRELAPLFVYGLAEAGDTSFAAMRTPPWPLITSPLEPADASGELIDLWLEADPEVTTVSGVPDTARAIAAAWAGATGGTTRTTMHEAMHVLAEVHDPPRPAAGTLRPPQGDERDLLVSWMEEFVTELG